MPKSDNANKLLHVPDSQTIARFSPFMRVPSRIP